MNQEEISMIIEEEIRENDYKITNMREEIHKKIARREELKESIENIKSLKNKLEEANSHKIKRLMEIKKKEKHLFGIRKSFLKLEELFSTEIGDYSVLTSPNLSSIRISQVLEKLTTIYNRIEDDFECGDTSDINEEVKNIYSFIEQKKKEISVLKMIVPQEKESDFVIESIIDEASLQYSPDKNEMDSLSIIEQIEHVYDSFVPIYPINEKPVSHSSLESIKNYTEAIAQFIKAEEGEISNQMSFHKYLKAFIEDTCSQKTLAPESLPDSKTNIDMATNYEIKPIHIDIKMEDDINVVEMASNTAKSLNQSFEPNLRLLRESAKSAENALSIPLSAQIEGPSSSISYIRSNELDELSASLVSLSAHFNPIPPHPIEIAKHSPIIPEPDSRPETELFIPQCAAIEDEWTEVTKILSIVPPEISFSDTKISAPNCEEPSTSERIKKANQIIDSINQIQDIPEFHLQIVPKTTVRPHNFDKETIINRITSYILDKHPEDEELLAKQAELKHRIETLEKAYNIIITPNEYRPKSDTIEHITKRKENILDLISKAKEKLSSMQKGPL